MGKYVKKTQVAKSKSTTNTGAVKVEQKRKKVKAKAKAAKQKRLAKFASDRSARRQADEVEEADAQMSMSVDVESRNAGERIVSFLEKARTDKKAAEAVKKVIRNSPGPEALGVALGHLAGRGLAHCVRMLIDSGALLNIQDPRQPVGRSTPLQLAASRGHVNAVRLLVEAGADKTGGVEAAQELSKLGAVFNEEKKAILSILNG